MNLTVVCVLVRGHVAFSVEYVTRLRAMVQRHAGRPFRFVCFTDQPEAMPEGVEAIRIASPDGMKGWWAKIELFNRKHGLTGRILYLDLDTLVVKALKPIIEFPAKFALVPDGAPNFNGYEGRKVVKRYNSSVMIWDAGARPQLYEDWTSAVASRLWGDQDWIGEHCPRSSVMPLEWFPRLSAVKPPLPRSAKIILAKKPKNHIAAAQWPWFARLWG